MKAIYQLETLDSLIEYNVRFAEKLYKETGFLTPVIIGYTRDNKQKVFIVGQFQDEKGKLQWANTASAAFRLFDIDKYVVMFEGRTVKNPDNDTLKKYGGSLENYPGRAACHILIAVNKHGAMAATSEIKPDKTLVSATAQAVEGRMCELLPNSTLPPLSAKDRDKLLALLQGQGISIEDI